MLCQLLAQYHRQGEPGDVRLRTPTTECVVLRVDRETYDLLHALAVEIERVARADDLNRGRPDRLGHWPPRRRPMSVTRLLYLLARGGLECYTLGRWLTSPRNPKNAEANRVERAPGAG